jgi:Porin subfamily
MKMVKSLLLGSAAGIVAVAGAQAADLPVKAHPVQYVKICSLYGAGFFYIPGTDTCIKVGGFLRAEVNFDAGGSYSVITSGVINNSQQSKEEYWRTRGGVSFDARSQTEYGTLRSYLMLASTENNSGGTEPGNNAGISGSAPYTALWSNAAFIQWAGFTVGKTGSFFDFDTQGYSNQTNYWGSNMAGGGIDVFAYTAEFGNGLSASIAAEQEAVRRSSITGGTYAYGNQQVPDIVGNLRIDQSWGSAQVMAAYHQDYASTAVLPVATASKSGWAVGGGLKVNLPMLGAKDNVIAQVAYTEGAVAYAGSNATGFALTNGAGTVNYYGQTYDSIYVNGGLDLTTAWSVTAGYEHWWNPKWRTSLYGAYGAVSYDSTATPVVRALAPGAPATGSANWNFGQIGSRTVWTPVENLDLSVEVMYNDLNSAYTSNATYGNKDWVSGIFRVQRNFWP